MPTLPWRAYPRAAGHGAIFGVISGFLTAFSTDMTPLRYVWAVLGRHFSLLTVVAAGAVVGAVVGAILHLRAERRLAYLLRYGTHVIATCTKVCAQASDFDSQWVVEATWQRPSDGTWHRFHSGPVQSEVEPRWQGWQLPFLVDVDDPTNHELEAPYCNPASRNAG